MEQEESLLAYTEKMLELEYKLEAESSTGLVLLAQLLQPTLPPLTSLLPSLLPPYTMS